MHRLYVAGEKGILSIFGAKNRDVSKIADGHIGPNADVVGVDAGSHRIYLPLMNTRGGW